MSDRTKNKNLDHWEVTFFGFSGSDHDDKELASLLNAGWEPFGMVGVCMALRRRRGVVKDGKWVPR